MHVICQRSQLEFWIHGTPASSKRTGWFSPDRAGSDQITLEAVSLRPSRQARATSVKSGLTWGIELQKIE